MENIIPPRSKEQDLIRPIGHKAPESDKSNIYTKYLGYNHRPLLVIELEKEINYIEPRIQEEK